MKKGFLKRSEISDCREDGTEDKSEVMLAMFGEYELTILMSDLHDWRGWVCAE